MFETGLYFDRKVSSSKLAGAFQRAYRLAPNQVVVIERADFERAPRRWFVDDMVVGLRTESIPGEFPLALDWFSRFTPDIRNVLTAIADDLDVVILTKAAEVNPLADDWLMVGPGGSVTVVRSNADAYAADDPAIILERASRELYVKVREASVATA
jgi:hypothetical protein